MEPNEHCIRLLSVFFSPSLYLNLSLSYIAWHESGTHLGKPLPVISMYPPLSILYNAFTNSEGRTAIEFHEVHHNRRQCNYGITQWIDMIMGSRMLKGGGKSSTSRLSTDP